MSLNAKTDFLTKGKIVYVNEGIGVVRYVNPSSLMIGIELAYEQDNGITTDGILNGKKYFKCRPKCGIFVHIKQVLRIIQPEELLREIIKLRSIMAKKQYTHAKLKNEINKLRKENNQLKLTITMKSPINSANSYDNNNEINSNNHNNNNIRNKQNISNHNNNNHNNNINNSNIIINHISQNSIHSSKSRGSVHSTPKNTQSKSSFGFPNTKPVRASYKKVYHGMLL